MLIVFIFLFTSCFSAQNQYPLFANQSGGVMSFISTSENGPCLLSDIYRKPENGFIGLNHSNQASYFNLIEIDDKGVVSFRTEDYSSAHHKRIQDEILVSITQTLFEDPTLIIPYAYDSDPDKTNGAIFAQNTSAFGTAQSRSVYTINPKNIGGQEQTLLSSAFGSIAGKNGCLYVGGSGFITEEQAFPLLATHLSGDFSESLILNDARLINDTITYVLPLQDVAICLTKHFYLLAIPYTLTECKDMLQTTETNGLYNLSTFSDSITQGLKTSGAKNIDIATNSNSFIAFMGYFYNTPSWHLEKSGDNSFFTSNRTHILKYSYNATTHKIELDDSFNATGSFNPLSGIITSHIRSKGLIPLAYSIASFKLNGDRLYVQSYFTVIKNTGEKSLFTIPIISCYNISNQTSPHLEESFFDNGCFLFPPISSTTYDNFKLHIVSEEDREYFVVLNSQVRHIHASSVSMNFTDTTNKKNPYVDFAKETNNTLLLSIPEIVGLFDNSVFHSSLGDIVTYQRYNESKEKVGGLRFTKQGYFSHIPKTLKNNLQSFFSEYDIDKTFRQDQMYNPTPSFKPFSHFNELTFPTNITVEIMLDDQTIETNCSNFTTHTFFDETNAVYYAAGNVICTNPADSTKYAQKDFIARFILNNNAFELDTSFTLGAYAIQTNTPGILVFNGEGDPIVGQIVSLKTCLLVKLNTAENDLILKLPKAATFNYSIFEIQNDRQDASSFALKQSTNIVPYSSNPDSFFIGVNKTILKYKDDFTLDTSFNTNGSLTFTTEGINLPSGAITWSFTSMVEYNNILIVTGNYETEMEPYSSRPFVISLDIINMASPMLISSYIPPWPENNYIGALYTFITNNEEPSLMLFGGAIRPILLTGVNGLQIDSQRILPPKKYIREKTKINEITNNFFTPFVS